LTEEIPDKLTRGKLYSDIERIRSEMQDDRKLRMHAQLEVFDLLEEALNYLEEKDTESSLSRAAFKIAAARCRLGLVNNQKKRLAIGIFFSGFVVLGLSAWAIANWQLWPQTA